MKKSYSNFTISDIKALGIVFFYIIHINLYKNIVVFRNEIIILCKKIRRELSNSIESLQNRTNSSCQKITLRAD
jgi:hypothetical protein